MYCKVPAQLFSVLIALIANSKQNNFSYMEVNSIIQQLQGLPLIKEEEKEIAKEEINAVVAD